MYIALQVIQHMNAGMTVVEACREVEIARSSFYYILENNHEAITEIQDIINDNNGELLGLMLLSKNELLRNVIEDGLSDKTKSRDRLAIFLKLIDLLQQMTQVQQVDDELEHQAHEFLKQGPSLVKVKSRFTATVSYETETYSQDDWGIMDITGQMYTKCPVFGAFYFNGGNTNRKLPNP